MARQPRRIDLIRREGPINVGPLLTVEILSYKIPVEDEDTAISSCGFEIQPSSGASVVEFTIFLDGLPALFYSKIRTQPGTVPIPYTARVQVLPGTLVTVSAENLDPVNTYAVNARLTLET